MEECAAVFQASAPQVDIKVGGYWSSFPLIIERSISDDTASKYW